MPPNRDRIFERSDHGLTVTARLLPGDGRHTCVWLAGEIDMASTAVLSQTVDWLTALAPVSVLVDLAELTFACSTLSNFVVLLRHAVPAGAELILWRARPQTEWVLRATGMADIATIRAEPSAVPN